MIPQSSLAASYALASQATRRGQFIEVAPNTALASLLGTCDLHGDGDFAGMATESNNSLSPADIVLGGAASESFEGVNDHALQMDEIVRRAKHATSFAFDFTRNVVNPQVKRVVELTQAYVDKMGAKRMEPLTISPVFVGRMFDTTAMQDMISPFKDAVLRNVPSARLTAAWPEQGLGEALKTGDVVLDDGVANHLSSNQTNSETLWRQYFSDTAGVYRPNDITEQPYGSDDALVLFLGANRLLESDEVPEGLNMDLGAYRAYLAELREQMAARLHYHYRQGQNRVKSRQLVINAPARPARGGVPSGAIQVTGDVYNDWLSKGGSPEALYQAVHEGRTLQFDVLLEDADVLAKRWLTTLGLLETQRKFERQTAITTGLRGALHQLYLDLPENLKGFVPYKNDGDLLAAVAERLSHFHVKDLDDLHLIARKAVCRVFYPHTDAEKILNAMDSVMKDHPAHSPREAALLVMIDYVTEWVVDALVLSPTAAE